MADSSSDSGHFRQRGGRRGPLRANRTQNHIAEDVTEKIHTLASTLQDTNRNLKHVDQMLGQYREYNNEQAEAITNLKETLEQSIGQLRSQRLSRNSGVRSASLSSLYASDLDGETPEGRHFQPTSPLRDYGETVGTTRRRSRSAVRFIDQGDNLAQVHSLHQSLRDLSSEQVRLQDDLNRELSRRNRTDAETKRRLEDLSDRLNESQRQETVSERVQRRLEEIEREIHSERQLVKSRQDQLGHMSVHLQEALKQQDAKTNEAEMILKSKILKMEGEKSKLEQDLEHSRRKLNQSENSRDALLHQIEDLRSQLLRAEEERLNLQHQITQVAIHQRRLDEQGDDRRNQIVTQWSDQEKKELEKQIWELREKLSHSAVMSEIEELKRCIERKDKEKAQLGMQIEVLTSDLDKRETQQQRMLNQLKEIQNNYKACEDECKAAELQVTELAQQLEESTKEAEKYLSEFRQSEALRLENEKKKEELKLKAQESIRHWKLRCKKLEHEIRKQTELHNQLMEKNTVVLKEKDDLKSQLLSAMHQMENLQKELTDVLEKRAKQEEELHCKEVKLNETISLHMALEQEIRDVRETANKLENELQKQSLTHTQIRTDKQHLEEELATINMIHEKDQARLLDMQAAIKNLSVITAELTNQLAEEEKSKKELQKTLAELQKQQESSQEEMATVSKQLKLERDVHKQELTELQSELQRVKSKHDQRVQEMMNLFSQEKEEADSHVGMLKHKRINSEDDHLKRIEEDRLQLHNQLRFLQNEKESILSMIGSEIDAACEVLSRDSVEKFTAVSLTPGVQKDPHRWLAETKTKLRWLCEEVKEREVKEKKLRHHLQQSRERLKQLTLSKETEHQHLIGQIEKQEQLLDQVYQEKKELLEKNLKKEEEIDALQERISALETSTQVALHHLESVPEKLNLLEDFRDFGDSHRQTEITEERYSKYKEIMGSLQQHLNDSKRRLEDFRGRIPRCTGSENGRGMEDLRWTDKKTRADISAIQSTSSNWRTNTGFMSSSMLSNSGCQNAVTELCSPHLSFKEQISKTQPQLKWDSSFSGHLPKVLFRWI
nr:centrosomal protein of 128 kDa isoform X5 [Pogona vitticeps]